MAKTKPVEPEEKLPTPPLRSRSESEESDDLLLSSESSFDSNDQHDDLMDIDADADGSGVATAAGDLFESSESQGATAIPLSQDLDLSPIDGSDGDSVGAANNSCDDLANVMEVEQEAIAVEESFIMSKQGDEEGEPTGPTPFKAKSLNVMFEGVAESEGVVPPPLPAAAPVAASSSSSGNHNRSKSIQVFLRIRPMADPSKISTIKVLPTSSSSSSSAPSTVRTIPPPGSFSEKQRSSSEGIAGESEGSELQTLKEVRNMRPRWHRRVRRRT